MSNSVGGGHREVCQPAGLVGTVGTSRGQLTNFFRSWSGKVGQKKLDRIRKVGHCAPPPHRGQHQLLEKFEDAATATEAHSI